MHPVEIVRASDSTRLTAEALVNDFQVVAGVYSRIGKIRE